LETPFPLQAIDGREEREKGEGRGRMERISPFSRKVAEGKRESLSTYFLLLTTQLLVVTKTSWQHDNLACCMVLRTDEK
jgi:hypothetical protein